MEGEEKDNSQLPYFTARLTVGGAKGAQLFSLKGQAHFIHFLGTVCQILK